MSHKDREDTEKLTKEAGIDKSQVTDSEAGYFIAPQGTTSKTAKEVCAKNRAKGMSKESLNKDWVGNSVALFSCNGASNHSLGERANRDFYSSDPICAKWLLKLEPQIDNIWENAVGNGALAEVFREAGKLKAISDIVDRGYYPKDIRTKYNLDFLTFNKKWKGDIVTNPPYNVCLSWAEHQLELLEDGRFSALFMKITFLEGKSRKPFLENNPPIRVWVSSSRIMCYKNGSIEDGKKNSSAACYAWFIWQKGYKGDTIIKWFN